ncbi:hypothetical protein H7F15_06490 [Pontibacter sp. Tf4]|uniref:hypothetical protein n=1 Tax=Pontibacter sp. Tf4 TaxID=2761620 RepID=UPI001625A629|nr:hypothetical protein [Pontibacter sp. Tf4]MBB6610678.1 hypothetical protein [Pontibacter sp. Tf4]
MAACALWSCTPDEPTTEQTPETIRSEEEMLRNTLVADTRKELKKWFRFYHLDEHADTLFRLREVWEVSLLTAPVSGNWQELYKEHPKLFKPSPDKTTVLDIYTYERVFDEKRRGKIEVSADSPDSEVAIVDTAKGEKTRLMFCGTPCQFHDAWWRTPNEVIVVGLVQETGEEYYPALWYINLTTDTIRQYTATQVAEPKKDKNYLVDEVFDEL